MALIVASTKIFRECSTEFEMHVKSPYFSNQYWRANVLLAPPLLSPSLFFIIIIIIYYIHFFIIYICVLLL